MRAAATYGLDDDTDLNVTVPLLNTDLELKGRIAGDDIDLGSSKFGIGDIVTRVKHRIGRGRLGQLAVGLTLRLPSGSEGDFQDLGAVEVAPALVLSTASRRPTSWLEIQGFLNAAMGCDTADVARSEGRWGSAATCTSAII